MNASFENSEYVRQIVPGFRGSHADYFVQCCAKVLCADKVTIVFDSALMLTM